MGIDYLDIHFRLEKRFRIKIDKNALEQFIEPRRINEMTAGDVCDFVEQQLRDRGMLHPAETRASSEPQGIAAAELESPYCFVSSVWPEVQMVLSDTLGVEVPRIERTSLLVRDLGMS